MNDLTAWIAERDRLDAQPLCLCGHSRAEHTDSRFGFATRCYDPDDPECECAEYRPAQEPTPR